MTQAPYSNTTRRSFLKMSLAASGALAFPAIIPSRVFGNSAPGKRITMALIGAGGRGGGVIHSFASQPDVVVVAVCDVDKRKREHSAERINQRYGNTDCKTYSDFREVLARPDIDAVYIATGDRWHAPISIMAMRAGKDVYCEKPGSLTIAEGQALVEAERLYGRVFQTGAQRASEANYIIAGELLRSGMLGEPKLIYAHLGYLPEFPRKNTFLPAEPEPSKDEFDGDMGLGQAPWRPYNSRLIRGYPAPGWYTQLDLGTGIAQWGSHTILQSQLDLGLADTSAVDYELPKDLIKEGMTIRFGDGTRLIARTYGWDGPCGVRYEGTEGWVEIADRYARPKVSSPLFAREFERLLDNYKFRTGRPFDHVRDFLDCVKSRRKPLTSAIVAHRSMTTNHAMDMCLDLQRNLRWDPVKEEFIGDDEANRLRSREPRKAWMGV